MSIDAIASILKLKIKPSSHKFVLFAMANLANEDQESYPSVDYLSEITSLDRKTILLAIRDLVSKKILKDTGRRAGKTRQIPVYLIIPAKQYQKRNSTEIGIVPKTEQYRFSVETVPKTVHGNKRDTKDSYSSSSKKNSQIKRAKTGFPASFEITEDMRKWFAETYPQYDIEKTTEQWRDACLAKDYRYKNWGAAWKNGMHFAHRNNLAIRSTNGGTFL